MRRTLLIVMMVVIPLLHGGPSQAYADEAQEARPLRPVSLSRGVRTIDQAKGVRYVLKGAATLVIEHKASPFAGGEVHLDNEDAMLVLEGFVPSKVSTALLANIFVNGQPSDPGQNIRLAQHLNGTAILPHGSDYQPLQTFRATSFRGDARAYTIHKYYKPYQLGEDNDKIASFILKRGYMATFAENADGTGASKVYIARDEPLRVRSMPRELRDNISFVRVFPWRWTNKKGYGGGAEVADSLHASWRYDWSAKGQSTLDMEYVPMRHNAKWDSFQKINRLENATHLLGFNEPMKESQGNMTMQQCLDMWPKLQQSGLRLGSPAPTDGTLGWLYNFMDQADERGYRVDFVAVHYYKGDWTPKRLIAWLKQIHERTGRPLWVTEFNNGAGWVKGHNPSMQENAARILAFSKAMDETDFVERYAVFNVSGNRCVHDNGKLTLTGNRYRDNPSAEAYTD